jgi:Na+-transporting methylmalonyl-CoA/oxaloacetate decarboxylase gamma subunit
MIEGLSVIAIGILVVLVMMFLMIVFIELMLAFDGFRSGRSASAEDAPTAPELKPDDSDDRAIAAIALALHQNVLGREAAAQRERAGTQGVSAWISTGRLEAMRQRSIGGRWGAARRGNRVDE